MDLQTMNSTKKRDELAERRSKRQCSTGNQNLDHAIAWYLRVGFEDGWDARDVEVIGLQARILKLEAALEKCKRQRDNYGIIADYEYSPKFANSELDLILE